MILLMIHRARCIPSWSWGKPCTTLYVTIMLYKTRGIVLNYMKYRETSIIARIFTELFGRQSYIIHGVRARKPRYNIALFQPLMPLDMVVYHKKHASIQRVAEVRCHWPIGGLLGDIRKAAIATFLTELLTKVIHEEEHNESLFYFLLHAVVKLNEQVTGYESFHLRFMLQLCSYLGFGIKATQEINEQLSRSGLHIGFSKTEIALLDALLAGKFDQDMAISKATNRHLTTGMVKYYQLHIDALDTLKSLKVMQEIGS